MVDDIHLDRTRGTDRAEGGRGGGGGSCTERVWGYTKHMQYAGAIESHATVTDTANENNADGGGVFGWAVSDKKRKTCVCRCHTTPTSSTAERCALSRLARGTTMRTDLGPDINRRVTAVWNCLKKCRQELFDRPTLS